MNRKKIVIALLSFLIYNEASDTAVCSNNGTSYCCPDYRNVSGNCEACIGSWGKECKNNCSYGNYGHGCRLRCNCTEQICDPKQGCGKAVATHSSSTAKPHSDEIKTYYYLLAVSGILILILLSTIVICHRIMKKRKKSIQRCADEEGVIIYNDIRESRMMNASCVTSTGVCNSPLDLNGVTAPLKMNRMTKTLHNQTRLPLTRSKTLESEDYGHWNRESDNYNHINFNTVKQLSSSSNILINDYEGFMSSKPSLETQINDKKCSGNKEFEKEARENNHQTRKFLSMVNRPYSSVKYNRKIRVNEDHKNCKM